ncbi:MAG: YbaN family protein [Pararhodobacter sp.]
MRILWGSLGGLSVGLGAAGVVLPLLPTTPFMLLAAYCFARSSPRAERWLLEHPRFGPAIADWRAHGAISARAKRWAMLALALAFGVSLVLRLPVWVLVTQGVALSMVALFLLSRPTPPPARQVPKHEP